MIVGERLDQVPLPLAYGTSFGKAVTHWAIRTIQWPQFCRLLQKPAASKTGAMSYIPGTIVPGPGGKCKCDKFLHRTKDTVRDRWAITLDADYCGNAGSGLIRNLTDLDAAVAIHTTWSSTEDDERYRVIIPLDRAVGPLEYAPIARWLMNTLGQGMFDATCDQHSRLMYLPAAPDGGDTYWHAELPGPALDVDFWLDIAGGPDIEQQRDSVTVSPGSIGSLSAKHQRQLKGLFTKLYDQEEGNRDSLLLWILKCVGESGMDPDIASLFLAEAAVACGLEEDVYWEKVERVLG